jgi:hypothetical protein
MKMKNLMSMLLGRILSQLNPVNNVVFYILVFVLILYPEFYSGFEKLCRPIKFFSTEFLYIPQSFRVCCYTQEILGRMSPFS